MCPILHILGEQVPYYLNSIINHQNNLITTSVIFRFITFSFQKPNQCSSYHCTFFHSECPTILFQCFTQFIINKSKCSCACCVIWFFCNSPISCVIIFRHFTFPPIRFYVFHPSFYYPFLFSLCSTPYFIPTHPYTPLHFMLFL